MSFKNNLYEVVRGAISSDVLFLCESEHEMLKKVALATEKKDSEDKFPFGDAQVSNSFSRYSVPCFEALSLLMLPTIEKITGVNLLPTYSYSRLYYNGAEMARHTDRPSCEYSATVCITTDPQFGPWDIWFKTVDEQEIPLWLESGDMIVYSGSQLEHWRNPYGGNSQLQAFLHYVDANGKNSLLKWDGRPGLGFSHNSRNLLRYKLLNNKNKE